MPTEYQLLPDVFEYFDVFPLSATQTLSLNSNVSSVAV